MRDFFDVDTPDVNELKTWIREFKERIESNNDLLAKIELRLRDNLDTEMRNHLMERSGEIRRHTSELEDHIKTLKELLDKFMPRHEAINTIKRAILMFQVRREDWKPDEDGHLRFELVTDTITVVRRMERALNTICAPYGETHEYLNEEYGDDYTEYSMMFWLNQALLNEVQQVEPAKRKRASKKK